MSLFIIMHCGGLPFNGETIKTKSLGGSESAAYYMAKSLAAEGHRVTLFTNHPEGGEWDGVRYVPAGQPSEEHPLGESFHYYASNTPSDVLIIQRAPGAFRYQWASKVNLLWLHDMPHKEQQGLVFEVLYNIQGILTVSEFHKQEIVKTWGVDPDIVMPITNGIDLDLYNRDPPPAPEKEKLCEFLDGVKTNELVLTYSSRPERGLEHLVKPNGIMHRLWEAGYHFKLAVCGYENTTPQMADYYGMLWRACEALPNVTNLGALSKQDLAILQEHADCHVYPTTFPEVSCITAMECMAAALPFLSCSTAALPETCMHADGSILLDLKDGEVDEDAFVETLIEMHDGEEYDLITMGHLQRDTASTYSWEAAADRLLYRIEWVFSRFSTAAIARSMVRNSDIYAARSILSKTGVPSSILSRTITELSECYSFAFKDRFAEHYANYYAYEKERGAIYGPEEMEGNDRFEVVAASVAALPAGSRVLDYGCAHGHYTIALAKRFPDFEFVGIDITASNIKTAKKWAADEGIENVSFHVAAVDAALTMISPTSNLGLFDAVIAAEVLEHVGDPGGHVDTLMKYAPSGQMIITTPYGPWEAIGYEEHYPWRAHLWHFERADLHDMYGHFEGFGVTCVPAGNYQGEAIGSYVYSFRCDPEQEVGKIDIERKIRYAGGRETLSLCMIVKNGEASLLSTLRSVKGVVDEVIVAIDPSDNGETLSAVDLFEEECPLWPIVRTMELSAPVTEIGFDAARNESISKASGDWIMWIDADEVVSYPERLLGVLKPNGWTGFGIPQHHFAVEPLGVLKTDFPVRLFRNRKGIRFYGVVHEHPEREINKGVGYAKTLAGVDIMHTGYLNEEIRRGRFDRNITLMARDREQYPARWLGKFLWMRDISQMCGYELERTGGQPTEAMRERAREGIEMWSDLMEAGQIKMLVDGLPFYSRLVAVLGGGFECSFKLDTSKQLGGTAVENVAPVTGVFFNEEDAKQFVNAVLHERVSSYE